MVPDATASSARRSAAWECDPATSAGSYRARETEVGKISKTANKNEGLYGAEGLDVTFEEGDAEALPYADARFDVGTSLIGAMFAPRPDRVAAELTRVCRPGGTIAMANWTAGGFAGQMFEAIARYIAPSGMPSPVLWGDEATVRMRLSEGISELRLTLRAYRFDYPFAPEEVVAFFRANYGPMTRAFASLDAKVQQSLRSTLVRLWTEYNLSR